MPQLLLTLALLLGGLRLFTGATSSTDVGGHWDPNGQPTTDVGGQWDPDGQPSTDVGNLWDPNG